MLNPDNEVSACFFCSILGFTYIYIYLLFNFTIYLFTMGKLRLGLHWNICCCFSHIKSVQFSSVQSLSRVWLCATPWIAAHQAFLSITNSNACSSSRWYHPAISSSVIPFSPSPQSLPASESFPMSQLFTWGGQSIGVSASTSVLPMNNQDWFF